ATGRSNGSQSSGDWSTNLIRISEPQAQRGLQAAHWIGGNRQSELGAVDGSIPAGEGRAVQQVGGAHLKVEIVATGGTEGAGYCAVQAELAGTGDGISAR